MAAARRWLLVTATTSGAGASTRVLVWRRLRGLGALYLQQSACLLPDRADLRAQVEELRGRVAAEGGSVRLLAISVTQPGEHDGLVAELNAARDEEYAEVLERLPAFFEELRRERGRGKVTFEEVEENESDLARFQEWTAKIAARDYFHAARGSEVMEQLQRAREQLAEFEAAAVASETSTEELVGSRSGAARKAAGRQAT